MSSFACSFPDRAVRLFTIAKAAPVTRNKTTITTRSSINEKPSWRFVVMLPSLVADHYPEVHRVGIEQIALAMTPKPGPDGDQLRVRRRRRSCRGSHNGPIPPNVIGSILSPAAAR